MDHAIDVAVSEMFSLCISEMQSSQMREFEQGVCPVINQL